MENLCTVREIGCRRCLLMLDVIYLATGLILFALMAAYVRACERL
ncbi:hypothetical protein BH10PSE7_BH10PSE7_13180 [soil metagenome]